MLFVAYKDGFERNFHVGEPFEGRPQPVREIQADGDELTMICHQFQGIRMCNARVVTWTGEDARFIARHLPQLSRA